MNVVWHRSIVDDGEPGGKPKIGSAMPEFAQSSHRPMANTVEGHRRDDDPADDRFLDPFGPTHLLSSHVQDCDNQCSDQATKNGTLAAEQTATADHHGGDHDQFLRD